MPKKAACESSLLRKKKHFGNTRKVKCFVPNCIYFPSTYFYLDSVQTGCNVYQILTSVMTVINLKHLQSSRAQAPSTLQATAQRSPLFLRGCNDDKTSSGQSWTYGEILSL